MNYYFYTMLIISSIALNPGNLNRCTITFHKEHKLRELKIKIRTEFIWDYKPWNENLKYFGPQKQNKNYAFLDCYH